MACSSTNPFCEPCPTMCANAGSNLDCIFNDISGLIKPFTPAINKVIVGCSGKPQTVAGKIGNFSSQQAILIGGLLVVVALIALHK